MPKRSSKKAKPRRTAKQVAAQDMKNLRRRKGAAAVKKHRPKSTNALGIPDANLDRFSKQPIIATIRAVRRKLKNK